MLMNGPTFFMASGSFSYMLMNLTLGVTHIWGSNAIGHIKSWEFVALALGRSLGYVLAT
jgi:hypothetical protein